jgi:hypothetical protein
MPSDPRLTRQLRDLQWRLACRQKLAAFASHALAVKNEFPALHHQHICTELQAVARGDTRRLMVLMPPGAGKTTYASRLFPPWYFASHPHANIIGASHTSELAETNSTYVQRYIRDNTDILDYGLLNEAKGNWERPTIAVTGRSASAVR